MNEFAIKTTQFLREKLLPELNFQLLLVLLIVISAFMTTQANSVATRSMNGAEIDEFSGSAAQISAGNTETLNHFKVFDHFMSYMEFAIQDEMVRLYDAALETAPADEARVLTTERQQAILLAMNARSFFPVKYVNPDGTYNIDRELGELWAEESLAQELDPSNYYSQADRKRARFLALNPLPLLGSLALLTFALIQALHEDRRLLRYILTGLGSLMLLVLIGLYFLVRTNIG